jgi:hypothetical protein
MSITNKNQIHPFMAAYLAHDSYDYRPGAISATTLMKPTKQYILSSRMDSAEKPVDVSRLVKSRIGTSVHDGVERVWVNGHYEVALRLLGFDDLIVDNVEINPGFTRVKGDWVRTSNPDLTGKTPVYVEIRTEKQLDGVTVTGKFDSVWNGTVGDIKTTSVYTWINQTKAQDYSVQGSIYKWLNPDIITGDTVDIHYAFTDWSENKSKVDRNYPPSQVLTQSYSLMTPKETERWIRSRLSLIESYRDLPQDQLPACTDKDLWRNPPVYKYYKNPNKLARATKNYDTLGAANMHKQKDGNVGTVIAVAGNVIACRYCDAYNACTQKDNYLADGTLKL